MIVGIPKGSLFESVRRLLSEAGIEIHLPARKCWFKVTGADFEAISLRPQEIAPYVASGRLDVGFTSRDLLTEAILRGEVLSDALRVRTDLRSSRVFMKPARWVVAVPRDANIKTLGELRSSGRSWTIATEIVEITREFLRMHGIDGQVEHSWGSTEGKAGRFCDAIVDIVHSGASLEANDLVEVADVFSSTTHMVSRGQLTTEVQNVVDQLEGRLASVMARYA